MARLQKTTNTMSITKKHMKPINTRNMEEERGIIMKVFSQTSLFMVLGLSFSCASARAQDTSMPGMNMPAQSHAQHQQMNMQILKPEYPKMGRAQEKAQ